MLGFNFCLAAFSSSSSSLADSCFSFLRRFLFYSNNSIYRSFDTTEAFIGLILYAFGGVSTSLSSDILCNYFDNNNNFYNFFLCLELAIDLKNKRKRKYC